MKVDLICKVNSVLTQFEMKKTNKQYENLALETAWNLIGMKASENVNINKILQRISLNLGIFQVN